MNKFIKQQIIFYNLNILGALIGGGASLLGGILGNQASAREASRNRAFQREMSNTSHQREVEDLRAAGLNPILSANKGASTPGGSMATQNDVISPAVNTALAAKRNTAEVNNMRATNENIYANTAKTVTENAKVKQEIENLKVNEQISKLDALIKTYSLPGTRNKERIANEINEGFKVLTDIQKQSKKGGARGYQLIQKYKVAKQKSKHILNKAKKRSK